MDSDDDQPEAIEALAADGLPPLDPEVFGISAGGTMEGGEGEEENGHSSSGRDAPQVSRSAVGEDVVMVSAASTSGVDDNVDQNHLDMVVEG